MKTVKVCNGVDGIITRVISAEISGDLYAWDFWYKAEDGSQIFGLSVEEDLPEVLVLNEYIDKWVRKAKKKCENMKFCFTIDL